MSSSRSSFSESGMRHHAYCRKQKSLGLLCSNFVSMYDRDGVSSICLDDAARRLGVERRRIYDIVNVLESVGILAKKGKNQYSWIGFSGVPKALDDLREEALRGLSCCAAEDSSTKDLEDEDEERSFGSQYGEVGDDRLSPSRYGPCKSRSDNRREKSLGQLTQNFVKLFLTRDTDMISLDEAARLLLGDGDDSSHMKNNNAAKVRRLYDIANVLSSVNLIEKTQQAETRKPAFRWLGFKDKPSCSVPVTISANTKQWNKREFGKDITNADFKRNKSISSVDQKTIKVHLRNEELQKSKLIAEKQVQGSQDYVFGPFNPVSFPKVDNKNVRGGKKIQDLENLASSFRPQYHNKALGNLFEHYMEAWNSWYGEAAQDKNLKPHKSITR